MSKDKERDDKSRAAAELGRAGGRKGGRARAKALTQEERSAISRAAAEARWASHQKTAGRPPKATHNGDLNIGGIEIPCFVLEGPSPKRVISLNGIISALGMSKGSNPKLGGDRLVNFLAGRSINPFATKALAVVINSSLRFRPNTGGGIAIGHEATVLADICDAVVDAKIAGTLQTQQEKIAERCRILSKGFSRVGIIALVDEATGYQADRDRDELHKILDKYISEELLPWTKRFPDEFYRQIYRLMGWTFPRGTNHPWFVGKATKNIVYKRLPPGVLDELERKNPAVDGWARKNKHHQWLSAEVGHPHLRDHLIKVITAMQVSDSWGDFTRKLTRIAPAPGEQQDLFAAGEPKPDPELEPPK